jgi:Flp pilus assembly protein protease CpaA
MEQLSAIAFGVSLLGGVHDLLTKRIPNWLTFPAMALGLAAQLWFFSWAGLLDGTLGLALGYMGAGDVKLLMAIGAWIGWSGCWAVAVGSVLLGAAYALAEITLRGRLRAVIINTYLFLRSVLVPGLVAEKLKLDHGRKFAFGLCLSLSVAGWIYLRHAGRIV